ncbi:hypothetical protein HON01_04645, partial [Candidatus Woesearchaeota archaeon]|nr:hypothetical protein [Candidatus Woesearchaeota archaeon]
MKRKLNNQKEKKESIPFNNKKGILSFNILVMIPRIVFMIIVFVCIIALVRLFIVSYYDVDPLIADVFTHSLVYSPGGVSTHDPLSGRVYPGIIDGVQFSENDFDL